MTPDGDPLVSPTHIMMFSDCSDPFDLLVGYASAEPQDARRNAGSESQGA